MFLFTGTNIQAKSYDIPKIQVRVGIDSTGTVHIREQLTYTFDGSFTWARYRLPKKGFARISNIRVSDRDSAYVNASSEEPGTFTVSEDEEALLIQWYYEPGRDKRIFTISYSLDEALTVGPGWSQFFWNFISDDREKSTDRLDMEIRLPQSVPVDSMQAWIRGPMDKIEWKKEKGLYSVQATDLNEEEFVEIRSVFPSRVLDREHAEVTDADFTLDWAREDEMTYRNEQIHQRERRVYLTGMSRTVHFGLIAVSLGVLFYLYWNYGRRYSSSSLSQQSTIQKPDDRPPAAVGWLLSGRSISSEHLLGTVLDLARRGYVTLHELPAEEGFWKDDRPVFTVKRTDKLPGKELLTWEDSLLRFVEHRLGEGAEQLRDIFDGEESSVSSWFSEWKKALNQYCSDQEWIDRESYTGAYWNAGIQFVLLCIVIAVMIGYTGLTAPVTAVICGVVILIAMLLSMLIIRRTKKGEEVHHRWSKYREGLKNASEHVVSSDTLGINFVYAVTLGVGEDQIQHLFASSDFNPGFLGWVVFIDNSPASVASSVSGLSATGTTSFVGTSVAAGASAGAAGGGASASAG